MKFVFWKLITIIFFSSCLVSPIYAQEASYDFTIAFGSCNKQYRPQPFWKEIIALNPDVFIWGGDNIYADTDNMRKLADDYASQKNNPHYQSLIQQTPILATWDDHDYGKNDAGSEWKMKEESQQLFLDFIDIPKEHPRRYQKGIYTSQTFNTKTGDIKIIILDTRYFRSPLQKSDSPNKRYTTSATGTILGEQQWSWLENELQTSTADFNIIVSSIQFLSAEHGFESWGNFPNEVLKLQELIIASKAKRVILLSGDRHISEFSQITLKQLDNPLIDFTSSGLTHAYTKFKKEPNVYRFGNVVAKPSFGILRFNLKEKNVLFEMRGENGLIFQNHLQNYIKK
ncbi:alkaline phosphatase D family protein [Aquimarina rhabdastrellae]